MLYTVKLWTVLTISRHAVYGHPTFDFVSTGNYFVIDRRNRVLKLIANGDGDDYEFAY